MKKILSLLICMCMVIGMLPVFTVSAEDSNNVQVSIGEESVKFSATTLEEMRFGKTNILTFTPATLDDSSANGVAVTGIGGKDAADESVQVLSRIKSTGNNDFRVQFNLNALTGKGNIIPTVTGGQWYYQDAILEFMVMPNEYVSTIKITDKGNTFAEITGLSTTAWSHVRVVIDSENNTSYTFVNDVLHTTNSSLSMGSDGKNCQNLRIFGYADENASTSLENDSDVYFYIDDVKFSQTTVTVSEIEPEPDPDTPIVADPTNNIPDWAEVAGLTKEPGVKIGDYTFKDSGVPGEVVANNFYASSDFSGEYTEDGFVMTKLTEPAAADRAATTNVGGNIQIVANIENDTSNNTSTYQHGLVGTYAVDLYVNSNLTMNLTGNPIRFDWTINTQKDVTSPSMGSGKFNTIRVYSNYDKKPDTNDFGVYSVDNVQYKQGDVAMPLGEDTIVRFVVDTQAGEMAFFIWKNNQFVYGGSGPYSGTILQSIYFTPRLGFAKGATFTFQGIKIYEIDRYISSDVGVANRNQQVTEALANESVMPASIVSNPNSVTENITLPDGTWSTTNEEVVTEEGVVKRGYDDEEVSLVKEFQTAATPSIQLFRHYKLTVPKRTGIVNEIIAEYTYNEKIDDLIVPVKRQIASDTYSKTFVSNLSGVYDFELDVTPSVSETYANDGKPVSLQAGFYDAKTGAFTPYATVDIYKDVAKYGSNLSSTPATVSVKNGEANTFKFKVDTINNRLWIYANGIKSKVLSYTGNGYVNAFRVYADESAEATDSIILSDAKVVSLFAFDNAEFADADINACANDSANITIADVTGNPADAYGVMGDLPAALSSYNVEWSSSSDYVDLVEKYAYRSSEDQDVVVTAKVYDSADSDIYVTKEFYINIDGTTDPEVLLESTLSKLAAMFITNQPADGLITDIVLPTSVSGNDVTWTSSNPDVLSAAGVINKNIDISEPAKVTLTATVTDGSATVEKNIEFTVAKRGGDVTLYTDTASIETPITGVVTYEADLNGTATLKDSNGKKITDLDANGTVKVVMDFNNSKVSVFENGVLIFDYIDFAEAAENFKTAESSNVTNEKVILDEYALYNYNIEKYGYLDELRKGVVTNNVGMISTTVGGAAVTWDSENTAILANDGTFNAPVSVTFFDVNFSITLPGGTGATYMETLSVVAIPETNIFAGSEVENQGVSVPAGEYRTALMFDGNYTDTMFRGEFIDKSYNIIIDMKNAQDISTMYIANKGLKSCDIYVSSDKSDWTLAAQPVFDGTIRKNIVTFDMANARYVKIDNIVYDGAYVDIYEIAGFAEYDASDKSYMDILEINMPEEYTLTASSITLPATGSLYGSAFTWKSSHPDVISADGTVTKPKTNTEVLLTVTSVNGTESSTKTFRYYVKGTGGAQGGSSSGGSGGGGGGGIYIGDNSSSAFPEINTTIQTPIVPADDKLLEDKLFEDVEITDWFYPYVLDLKNENIVNGDNNNCFNPNNYVTREEFVKMIVNAAGIELVENGEGFGDVKATDWFAPYVYAAKANGIVKGISETKFGVGRAISRQDMAVIINNMLDSKTESSADIGEFTDDASISSYAYEAVYKMKSLGILNGYESGEFNPYGNLTRAEAAKVIAMVTDIIK